MGPMPLKAFVLLPPSLFFFLPAPVTFFVTAALPPELFGTSAAYPQTFALVVTALLVVAVAATYLPSRSAAGIDPQQALKSD